MSFCCDAPLPFMATQPAHTPAHVASCSMLVKQSLKRNRKKEEEGAADAGAAKKKKK